MQAQDWYGRQIVPRCHEQDYSPRERVKYVQKATLTHGYWLCVYHNPPSQEDVDRRRRWGDVEEREQAWADLSGEEL